MISFWFVSNWRIFLLEHPARKIFCLSSAGWNLTQNGVRLFVKLLITFPVSVSQSYTTLSKPALKNLLPSFEKQISLTAFWWPWYVLMHFRWVMTSHILTDPSWLALNNKWPVFGKNFILWTPLSWPDHVCSHFFGMKQSWSLLRRYDGASTKLLFLFWFKAPVPW